MIFIKQKGKYADMTFKVGFGCQYILLWCKHKHLKTLGGTFKKRSEVIEVIEEKMCVELSLQHDKYNET